MEENEIRKLNYNEAMRFYKTAKKILRHAISISDSAYSDKKYIEIACDMLCDGMFVALDGYLTLRGIELEENRDIGYYRRSLVYLDGVLFNLLNRVYEELHIWAYYDGIESSNILKEGFKEAKEIIDYIKPK
jgi:hypothetical protein